MITIDFHHQVTLTDEEQKKILNWMESNINTIDKFNSYDLFLKEFLRIQLERAIGRITK